jgi:hypothetical protein
LSEANRGVIVDGKPQIVHVLHWKQTFEVLLQFLLLELLGKVFNAQILPDVLEEDLQEHSGSSCSGIGSESDGLKDAPVDDLAMEEVAEEVGEVSDLVGLLVEDVVVVAEEGPLEEFLEFVVVDAETLGEQAEEGLVDALHHAALEDHVH